jgi:glycosyltransferase involved in cell wall biosynthesis
MRLDVLVATYNRSALLSRALESLLVADRPGDWQVTITVVDNRSTDDTKTVVESFVPRFDGRLQYLYESRAGRSHALNAGIAATSGELVAMIDDDEEVDRGWLLAIAKAFEDPTTDFIGGPYIPRWGGERPAWLGTAYKAAVGWVDGGPGIRQYGAGFDGMLMGGNAIVRRSVLNRVGPYSPELGRSSDGRLLSCEDRDMFNRLLAIGAKGFYRPDLVILHYVPAERLTKRYFRRWSFWHGVSLGVLDRRRPEPVPYLLGVPRYMIGLAVHAAMDTVRRIFAWREPARIFKNELAWWDLIGFFFGKHVYRS